MTWDLEQMQAQVVNSPVQVLSSQLVLLRQHHLLTVRVSWVAGSASRLLCFFCAGGDHFAVAFAPFLLLPIQQMLPATLLKSTTKFCPLACLCPAASFAFLFISYMLYGQKYSPENLTLCHTALLTLKLAKINDLAEIWKLGVIG